MIVSIGKEELIQAVKLYIENRIKIGTHEELTVELFEDGAGIAVTPKSPTQQE